MVAEASTTLVEGNPTAAEVARVATSSSRVGVVEEEVPGKLATNPNTTYTCAR